jgi:hypothetical protein
MHNRLLLILSSIALAFPDAMVAAQGTDADAILGRWRIVRTAVAPWVRHPASATPKRRWIGQPVTFGQTRVDGPGVLRCARARYKATSVPAERLFRSSLRAPTADAAALGLVLLPVPSTRLSCDSGVLELHRADAATLLVAIDEAIITLSRAPGTLAPDTSPAGVVERLLEHHFAGNFAFDKAHFASHAPWLTTQLTARITKYMSTPRDESQAPAINGDLFTDSQEHPTRFSVSLGTVKGEAAAVPVRFAFGRRGRSVEYFLKRENGAWRVNDLRYERRGTLGKLLRSPP